MLSYGCGQAPVGRAPGPGDFTEGDVQAFVTPGRSYEEITNRFGQPRLVTTNGDYVVSVFASGLPDTTIARQYVTKGHVFSGFRVYTIDGKAVKWGVSGWRKWP